MAAVLRAVLATTPEFRYVLEDDWPACRGLLSSIALEAAHNAFGDVVSAVRVSYGLNGVAVPPERKRRRPRRLPLQKIADEDKNPPDHAFTAWALRTGTLVTFRHDAFVHVGSQSSIGNSGGRWKPPAATRI